MAELNSTVIRPCGKCGAADRSKTGVCRNCSRLATAKYRAKNYDRIKAEEAARCIANNEKPGARFTLWRSKNIEKAKLSAKLWVANNKDKKKAIDDKSRLKNLEKIRAEESARRRADPEKRRLAAIAWRASNPDAVRVIHQNRRSRKREAGGRLSSGLIEKLFALQKGKCACCRKPLGDSYHLDHIMPLALGGSNTDDNVQLLTAKCNMQKNAKHPVDFMQSRGFLI